MCIKGWSPVGTFHLGVFFLIVSNLKNGNIRERVIDRCLRNRRGYSTFEIMEACNRVLEEHGYIPVSAPNTIRNDISSIQDRYHIVVEEIRSGKSRRYRYKDPSFSMFSTPLNDNEVAQLSQTVEMLRRFEGTPGFEWVEEIITHFKSTMLAPTMSEPVIGFDDNKLLKGMEFYTRIYESIINKKVLIVDYRPFGKEVVSNNIHPYYMRQYNNRWFFFAFNEERNMITTYALDRVEGLRVSNKQYIENTFCDFSSYFDDIVGVSKKPQQEPTTIKLKVTNEQYDYLESKPIHQSQKLIERTEEYSIISICVILNYEIQTQVLALGETVEVLEPTAFRDKISSRIKENFKKYFKVQID